MICPNCFNTNTAVVNSRQHKKASSVWRRRRCSQCRTIFTTTETPALETLRKVHSGRDKTDFNLGKLIISISRAFSHNPTAGKQQSLALATTISQQLVIEYEILTPEIIGATTHQVLKRFDQAAAMQYALQHELLTSLKRAGRPSLAWREPPTEPSPSR